LAKFGEGIEYLYEDLKRGAVVGPGVLELRLSMKGKGKCASAGIGRSGAKTALWFEFRLERAARPGIAKALIEADSATNRSRKAKGGPQGPPFVD
jgi:hypothetical protein